MNAQTFLETVAGVTRTMTDGSADKPLLIGTIDPAYVTASFPGTMPKVTFDGEAVLSGKQYTVITPGYRPTAGDRVILVPVGTTYAIIGSLSAAAVAYIGGALTVAGTATAGNLTTAGTLTGGALSVSGISSLTGAVTMGAAASVAGALTVTGDASAAGASLPRGILQQRAWNTTRVAGLTNTELVLNMDAGSFTYKAGRNYSIAVTMKVTTSVVTDDWIFRLRETNATGTQRGEFVWRSQSTAYGWSLPPLTFPYQPASDTTVTMVWTGQRLAGTGSLTVGAGTSAIQGCSMWIEDKGPSSAVTIF